MAEALKEVVVLKADEGSSHWIHDNLMTVKAASKDTGGSYSLVELVTPTDSGPPLHTHTQEEALYVLEGEMTVKVGDDTVDVEAGSFLMVPRDTPHTFQVRGDGPAKMLLIFSPPGYENFFIEAGRPAEEKTLPPPPEAPPRPEEMQEMVAISEKHGGYVVGPPLGH